MKFMSDKMPKGSLKYLMHRHLSRSNAGRSLNNIHASELTKIEGLCPRLYALSDLLKLKPKDEYITASQEVTFHIGRVLQDSMVDWLAEMGKAVGDWECSMCHRMHYFQTRPGKCTLCGCSVLRYKEVRFKSEECGASCGIDIFANLGGPKLRGVEIKTMDKDEFKELKAPLSEHRLRSNLYLRIMDDSPEAKTNLIDLDAITILYISKGGYGCADPAPASWGMPDKFSPFKEYTIKRDDKQTDVLWERAKVVNDYRKGLVGIPTGLCTTAMSKRASYCLCKGPCFSGEYPATYEWQK